MIPSDPTNWLKWLGAVGCVVACWLAVERRPGFPESQRPADRDKTGTIADPSLKGSPQRPTYQLLASTPSSQAEGTGLARYRFRKARLHADLRRKWKLGQQVASSAFLRTFPSISAQMVVEIAHFLRTRGHTS